LSTNTINLPKAITLDGPAASGKTTVGRMLADRLGYLFIDTGCMYRAVTLAALKFGIPIDDEDAVVNLAGSLDIDIKPPTQEADGRAYTVLLNSEDVTWDIRSAEVDKKVSQVSSYNGVRRHLVDRQRLMANQRKVVMVGRDIGTVVLPNAPLKLYIVASAQERAMRRWHEQKARDEGAGYEQILTELIRRDRIDGNRKHSPMRPAGDAIIIDTSGRSPEEILKEIMTLEILQPA
jgi:cytidylate kinase